MRFMIMGLGNEATEAGVLPSDELIAAMHAYNAAMTEAGVLVAAEALHPMTRGARISYRKGKAVVIDGPFTETKEVIAGFWIIEVESKEEAVAWALKMPYVQDGEEGVEIREVFEVPELDERIAEERARGER
ncbi:YciI family protein [Herbidospora sp. NEAU-GS84]|uniref:YciI family protein n=1 Tax=Herbidospora solisilvae TaxID=2696284 RepID=A0A7C9MU80_9ACTN|nr:MULTISPECIES: YciI family protein [Herbidospora]NAS20311.1 YciI family protein [Herbidospora solisilvae]